MTEPQIRFEDGAGYERMMGVWSRSAGQIFLDWLAPKPGLAWVDVSCGNGAFTELSESFAINCKLIVRSLEAISRSQAAAPR